MALWKKMALPPSPKKEIRTPPRNLKYSQALATKYEKKISPPQKKIFVGRREYIPWKIMITNTDYQKFVRLGDQK